MRFVLSVLLIAVLAFLAGMFLPWWSIAIIAFLVALFLPQHIGLGFLSGFLGIFLLWGMMALWIDIKNESILSTKMATLFPLGGSPVLIILVTALVGALVGGFAAMAGNTLSLLSRRRS
jgi:hypothetical protein